MPPKNSQKLRIRIDDLIVIDPLTENQKIFFGNSKTKELIVLHGVAGTGKTFIALYRGLEEVLDYGTKYHKLVIVRSAVPSRDIGFLPGSVEDKSEVYEAPYSDICSELFNRYDAYQRLKEQKAIEFVTTSHIRGITLNNSVILVDELQNMNFQEINSVMTRIGKNTKVIFCGDFRQTDLNKKGDVSGLSRFLHIIQHMPSAMLVEFDIEDIVRSKLVKEFIIASLKVSE